jgi:hypothetical protein
MSGYFSFPKITEAMQPCSLKYILHHLLLSQFHVRDPWLLPWQWNVSSSGTVTVYVAELACSVSEAKHSSYYLHLTCNIHIKDVYTFKILF